MSDELEPRPEVPSEGVPSPWEPTDVIDITELGLAADSAADADSAARPVVTGPVDPDPIPTGPVPTTGADASPVDTAGPHAAVPDAAHEAAPPVPAPDGLAADAGSVAAADGTARGLATELADADTEPSDTPPLRKVLEAILLVVDEPVPEVDLAQVVEAPRAVVLATLEELAAEYVRDGRGFELRAVAGGWRLYTTTDCAPYIERFVLDGQQARLTQAALETLAVIAYRQPVSRQSVAAIRGVNVDGVVRTLLGRGLIAEAGEEGPSGAHLYVTTPYFLERLGLPSLDELPNLAPLLPVNLEDLADHS